MKLRKLKLRFNNSKRNADMFGTASLTGNTGIYRTGGWVENFDVVPDITAASAPSAQTRISNLIAETSWLVFLILITFGVSIVAARAFFLQVYSGASYRAIAEGNRIRDIPILPKRGLIYDSNGIELATNEPLFLLATRNADLPTNIDERKKIFARLRGFGSEFTDAEFEAELVKKPEVIASELTYEEALVTIPIVESIPGVSVSLYERRNYINPEVYSHVIGYLGPLTEDEVANISDNYLINDYVGKIGVENIYEEELRGLLGVQGVEVDSKGKIEKITSTKAPTNGLNLHLSINSQLQEKAFELVDEFIQTKEHKRASFIAVEPATGRVLTLLSYPGYDNQAFYRGIDTESYQKLLDDPNRPLFNRSVSGQYPPGSTFKTILATAGLEKGIITPNTTFLSTGGIQVSRWFFPDWKAGGHGYTNVYKAIAESVNTYFYILGGGYKDFVGLGAEVIRQKASDFGLLKPTGIDLNNEAAGFYPTPEWKKEVKNEPWYIGDTYNLSIGQGDVLVTPIQMAMLTSAIANGGTLFKPHVIDYFTTKEGEKIFSETNWVTKESVGDTSAISTVKRAMRETVIGPTGSARSMQIVPSSVAGKTGTAQWSTTEDPHGWFIGFAPYEDPEIAVVVLTESSGGGSTASVPIARSFLTWYFTDYKQSL